MSSTSRRALVGALAIVVAVALFLILRDGDGEAEGDSVQATSAAQTSQTSGDAGGSDKPEKPDQPEPPEKPPEPPIETIVVENGQPVDGVAELEFTKGEEIRFRVRSDVSDHVHLHGYDVFQDVAAGETIEFSVPATLDGVFEVELEDRVVPLAEIVVEP